MKISKFLALASLSLLAWKAEAAPVGMAAHVSGSVSVTSDGKKTPLRLLARLEEGATINCGPGSSAVVVLFGNGERFQIGAGKSASVRAASVAGAQRLGGFSGPSASAVKLLGSARVGADSSRDVKSLQRLLPTSKTYIDSAAQRFDWSAVPGATKYQFTLFDGRDNVVWTASTDTNGVIYPLGALPLQEKLPYLWTVSAFGASGSAVAHTRGGLITFLSRQDIGALESLAFELQNQAKTATDTTPLLLLAEVYLSYGVTGEALEVLEGDRLFQDPSVTDAKADIYVTLSPFARAMAGPAAEKATPAAELVTPTP